MNDKSALIEIGKFGRPHGVRGDLRIFLHNPNSELADSLESLQLKSPSGDEAVLSVRKCRRSGDGRAIIVSTDECQQRESAALYTGWFLMYPKSGLPGLNEDEYYFYQLEKADVVTESGTAVGRVQEVVESGVDTLRISRGEAGELMIPIVREFVLGIDVQARKITVIDNVVEIFSLED